MAQDILVQQSAEISELNRLIRNYKADGPQRKTKKYLDDKVLTFNELFRVISENNKKLQSFYDENQPYFSEKTFEKIKQCFDSVMIDIYERLKVIQCSAGGSKDVQNEKPSVENPKKTDDTVVLPSAIVNIDDLDSTFENRNDSFENSIDGIEPNIQLVNNNISKNSANDILMLQRGELLELFSSARILRPDSSKGLVKAHIENISIGFGELRKLVFIRKSVGEEIDFDYNEFFQIYMELMGKLNDLLKSNSSLSSNAQFLLPSIKLPEFSGKPEDWKSFIALFDKIVHNNDKLDTEMKIEYLKTCVKNAAARLIGHLDPIAENYETCYSLLRKRYDNNREVVSNLLDKIFNLNKNKHENSDSLKAMHDTVFESLMAIRNLGITDSQLLDHLIIHILTKKLDVSTLIHYECQLQNNRDLQSLQSFLFYIENRFMALQAAGKCESTNSKFETAHNKFDKTNYKSVDSSFKKKCLFCEANHAIVDCQAFKKEEVQSRVDWVKNKKLCANCLSSTHRTHDCKSKFTCRICKKHHHTLLHLEIRNFKSNLASIAFGKPIHVQANHAAYSDGTVLLATAMIAVLDKNRLPILLRALLDQGSQSAFISETAAQNLKLRRKRIYATVSGIGATIQVSKSAIMLDISPRFESDFIMTSEAIVLPTLTKKTNDSFAEDDFDFVNGILLADPSFLRESEIDIILGAAEYAQAIKSGLIKSEQNLIAQNTEFGWIVSGATSKVSPSPQILSMITNVELDDKLSKFFNNEEFVEVDALSLTEEESMCEDHYTRTHFRDENGRFVVSLPFKNGLEKPDLGDSRRIAIASLLSLERRFISKPDLKIRYSEFLNEYISAGHMREVKNYHPDSYYLPHHCVLKESTTTKLRVVFNASQTTSNGKSLNEQLALGPMDQNDMVSILMRWRKHRVAFTADLEKMYRQILVNDSQTHLQRILWRESPRASIKEFELRTVTYGTANAPFLAIRTLKQLSIDGATAFPLASEVMQQDFYVDDVLSGADSLEKAQILYDELIGLTSSACLNLRKWSSNSNELLSRVPSEKQELQSVNDIIRALGVSWCTKEDKLLFDITVDAFSRPTTKRQLASEIASLTDPLGFISPVIVVGKHIFQELWAEKLNWDDPVPSEFVDRWIKLKSEFHLISNFSISRWIDYIPLDIIELHGFCDAAVIFIKNVSKRTAHFLFSKTRVTPIKEAKNSDNLTIPRLELCGALLLAQLTKKILEKMDIEFSRVCLWSDSKIVLDWIHANPKRYKIFIASRITKINKLVDRQCWSHVRSEQNPADCASRGISPSELVNHHLWWHGPQFLVDESLEPPRYKPAVDIHAGLELKTSFNSGVLKSDELSKSELAIVRVMQNECFELEKKCLQGKQHNKLPRSNAFLSLSPFVDEAGILRVGGRLRNANMPFEAKHQILLPKHHSITALIIKDCHERCLHGAPKLTESVFRQKFWVTQSYSTIKSVLHRCVKCFKVNPKSLTQFMGDLPAARITPGQKPFTSTAVDYTGAVLIKLLSGRGYKTHKAYVAIFVCMATKAIHIEAVTDLTADAFIASFRRFVSRRGVVRDLFSDNGTNFVSSNKILMENLDSIDAHYDSAVCEELAKNGTRWHFSPPGAPHFNGLAEAAVKSVKLHLKKILTDAKLTFEELSTLLAQIEACVNSRPLCSFSSDPNDVGVLTPAHFLVGESLISPPEQCHLETKAGWLTRWQKVQQMAQHFWKRWQSDYLNQLQVKSKWFNRENSLRVNDMCLIRDENLPPTQWKTGRVTDVHPGEDGLVRVVTLKTKDGQLKRPIAKLCSLPYNNSDLPEEKKKVLRSNCIRIIPKKRSFGVLPILTTILALCATMTHQAP
ncbi:uncharacterized protein LOC116348388, partial [Contarinia nasturtii]|uniref:uncharacterized protein LOC116348388 n=1 Tax=Contarinia nasturtii TaxID=265458 RepID=UPI0012D3ED41